jgi:manganese/zinc/iron transport system permease protein
LTEDGFIRAEKVVRLHRLWEVYLVDYLGQGAEKVHANAETMEHMITPELEKELIELLGNPQKDPHHQPIPPKRGGL